MDQSEQVPYIKEENKEDIYNFADFIIYSDLDFKNTILKIKDNLKI